MKRLVLAAALALSGAAHAEVAADAAQTPVGSPLPAVVFAESGRTRAVDCHGADLSLTGDGNALTLANCDTILISGSRNRVGAQLMLASSISVFGNDNVVHWTPAPGASPQVSATGQRNEINPMFSRADSRPVPFAAARPPR